MRQQRCFSLNHAINDDGFQKQKQILLLKDRQLGSSWITQKEIAAETDQKQILDIYQKIDVRVEGIRGTINGLMRKKDESNIEQTVEVRQQMRRLYFQENKVRKINYENAQNFEKGKEIVELKRLIAEASEECQFFQARFEESKQELTDASQRMKNKGILRDKLNAILKEKRKQITQLATQKMFIEKEFMPEEFSAMTSFSPEKSTQSEQLLMLLQRSPRRDIKRSISQQEERRVKTSPNESKEDKRVEEREEIFSQRKLNSSSCSKVIKNIKCSLKGIGQMQNYQRNFQKVFSLQLQKYDAVMHPLVEEKRSSRQVSDRINIKEDQISYRSSKSRIDQRDFEIINGKIIQLIEQNNQKRAIIDNRIKGLQIAFMLYRDCLRIKEIPSWAEDKMKERFAQLHQDILDKMRFLQDSGHSSNYDTKSLIKTEKEQILEKLKDWKFQSPYKKSVKAVDAHNSNKNTLNPLDKSKTIKQLK